MNELNDYAGQRELVAEEMAHKVYGELMKYSQDLKAERKHVSMKSAWAQAPVDELKQGEFSLVVEETAPPPGQRSSDKAFTVYKYI